jgi:hypothetical protein
MAARRFGEILDIESPTSSTQQSDWIFGVLVA